eukprot:COSAG01_NODE_822_length_13306_cov_4.866132_7_plen_249_part_00
MTAALCSESRQSALGQSFFCAEHKPAAACGVCGQPTGRIQHATHMQPFTQFALCELCTARRGQSGGDLLELSQSSMANIVAAAKLTQYVTDLETSLQLDDTQGATLRRVLNAPARDAIEQHMHVHDDEKVQLAESYRDAQHYAGHCCAVCGVRDAASAYSCKMFTLAGPPCAGPGYLRRRGGPDSDSPIVEQLIELPPWIRMSCAAAAVLATPLTNIRAVCIMAAACSSCRSCDSCSACCCCCRCARL